MLSLARKMHLRLLRLHSLKAISHTLVKYIYDLPLPFSLAHLHIDPCASFCVGSTGDAADDVIALGEEGNPIIEDALLLVG